MAEYHVSCGMFGIYAGILKNKDEWKDKTNCTDEAIEAVRDYIIMNELSGFGCSEATSGGYEWTLKDGRKVKLMVVIEN